MALLLLRHAHAVPRSGWDDPDELRPLSRRGREQSRLLLPILLEWKPERIVSSPFVRCVDTVRPTADAVGCRIETEERLAEGSGRLAVELVRSLRRRDALLCSHGDVIPEVLNALALDDDVDLGPNPKVEKASVWVLRPGPARFESAIYLEPPRARRE